MKTSSLALALLPLLMSASPCRAFDGDSSGMKVLSRTYRGQAYRVALSGTVAYAGLDSGVDVINLSNPDAPARLSHFAMPSEARGVALLGATLVVADSDSGVRILDISIPAAPSLLAEVRGYPARAVATADRYAFVGEGSESPGTIGALHVIDLTTPASATNIGVTGPLPDGAVAVCVVGSHVYVAYGSRGVSFGIATIDVSDPTRPTTVALLPLAEAPTDLAGTAGTLWVALATGSGGMVRSLDLSTPAAPVLLGRLRLPDAALGIALASDGTAYVAASALGLAVIDARVPSSPTLVTTLAAGRLAAGVAVSAGTILVAERGYVRPGGVAVVTATSPSTPVLRGRLDHTSFVDAAASPGLAYALSTDALHVLDMSNPSAPVEIGRLAPPTASFVGLEVQGSLAAVADDRSVRLIDVSVRTSPTEVAVIPLPAAVVRGVLAGTLLYALHDDGVAIYDVSAPASPRLLGSYPAPLATDVAITGATAYLVAGGDLHIVDVSNPSVPSRLGIVRTSDILLGVRVLGTHVYATGYDTRMHIFDVAASPAAEVATIVGGPAFGLALSGAWLYVAAAEDGVLVYELSSPAAPVLIASYDTSGTAYGVGVDGFTVQLAAGDGQMWTIENQAGASACSATSNLSPKGPITLCGNQGAVLDGSASILAGCPAPPAFLWRENGVVLAGATSSTYAIPVGHGPGSAVFDLTVSCPASPTCSGMVSVQVIFDPDAASTVAFNSVRAKKSGMDVTLAWLRGSGTGGFNFHRTLAKGELTALYSILPSLQGTTAGLSVVDAGFAPPPGQAGMYQVYGRTSCTGVSVP